MSAGPVAAASHVGRLRNNSKVGQIQTCCGWALPPPRSGQSQRDCVRQPKVAPNAFGATLGVRARNENNANGVVADIVREGLFPQDNEKHHEDDQRPNGQENAAEVAKVNFVFAFPIGSRQGINVRKLFPES